jgi:signal transduction histidine kinase
VLGALTLVYADSNRRYSEADLAVAEELGRRAAMSLDNALLYGQAQEAISARDSFLSIASHELNTPLTSIRLNFQTLQRALMKLPSEAAGPVRADSKFQAIERQLVRLSNLVVELLDVSRITSGRLKLEPEPLDFAALVQETVARCADEANRNGCVVQVNAPEPIAGCWDRMRLDQVATNLLSNAIKYGHGKPIVITARQKGEIAELTVQDFGIGIAPEDQDRLFQRFERIASERNYSGWGLGLWIVRQVLDAMGGSIQVDSQPGAGSTFIVKLPRTLR